MQVGNTLMNGLGQSIFAHFPEYVMYGQHKSGQVVDLSHRCSHATLPAGPVWVGATSQYEQHEGGVAVP